MTGQFIYKKLSDAKRDVMRDIKGEFSDKSDLIELGMRKIINKILKPE